MRDGAIPPSAIRPSGATVSAHRLLPRLNSITCRSPASDETRTTQCTNAGPRASHARMASELSCNGNRGTVFPVSTVTRWPVRLPRPVLLVVGSIANDPASRHLRCRTRDGNLAQSHIRCRRYSTPLLSWRYGELRTFLAKGRSPLGTRCPQRNALGARLPGPVGARTISRLNRDVPEVVSLHIVLRGTAQRSAVAVAPLNAVRVVGVRSESKKGWRETRCGLM
jgi:hypothetical protein